MGGCVRIKKLGRRVSDAELFHELMFIDGLTSLMVQWQFRLPYRDITEVAKYCIQESLSSYPHPAVEHPDPVVRDAWRVYVQARQRCEAKRLAELNWGKS